MARITVEDCIKLINNQYDLVILAKERAVANNRDVANHNIVAKNKAIALK